jgi:FAD/FMN-containing dehydrogenase
VLPKTVTRPTIVSLCNAEANSRLGLNGTQPTLLVGYEEKAETVRWQISKLNHELPDEIEKCASEFQGDLANDVVRRWSDFPLAPPMAATFKANMLPAKTAEFFAIADGLNPRPALMAHAGNGIVFGHIPRETPIDEAKALLDRLRTEAVARGGNLVMMRCPAEWKSVVPVWGHSTPDRKLMKAVKQKLDPGSVFNPARFVEGI